MILSIHKLAQADLRAIAEFDRITAAMILRVLKEIQVNDHLASRLLDHGYSISDVGPFSTVSVSQIRGMFRKGHNTWRLKCFDMAGNTIRYRILYIYEPVSQFNLRPRCHVAAIAAREELDYDDPDNPYIQRLLQLSDNLY